MFLELDDVSRYFGSRPAVSGLSFGMERGELLCILGPSGCGKTTTLNMIGGFIEPDAGRISLDGADITRLPPERRPVATVFQSYALFPHKNVEQNVMYGLRYLKMGRDRVRERARSSLDLVGLADRAEARIEELSGGEQQRVALARALAVEPKLCLLDEPFSNLDAALRVRMRAELKRIQREIGMTMIFVTHDQEEAMILADRMAVMNGGELVQIDAPRRVAESPATPFVRGFLNVEDLYWDDDGILTKKIRR